MVQNSLDTRYNQESIEHTLLPTRLFILRHVKHTTPLTV